MEDDLYGCVETATVAEGSLESTLYEGLFLGLSSFGHHEAYLQHKVDELEGLVRERNEELHTLKGQLEDRNQQLLNVTAERDVLLRNISCLYNTAKEEMARKQAEINSLRADIATARQQQQHAQRPMQRDLHLCCPTLPAGVEAIRSTGQASTAILAGSKRGRDAAMDASTQGNNGLRSEAEKADAKRTRCHGIRDGPAADNGVKEDNGARQQNRISPQTQPGKKFVTTSALVEARGHSSCQIRRSTGRRRSCEGGASDDRVQRPVIHQVSNHRANENGNGHHESHGFAIPMSVGELNASTRGSEGGGSHRGSNHSRAGYLEGSKDNIRERLRERDGPGDFRIPARESHESTRCGYENRQRERDPQRSGRHANPSDVDASGPRFLERSAGTDTGRDRDLGRLKDRGFLIGDRARELHGSERSGGRTRQEREWPLARD
ncbi:hypothetical protein VaNZ11_013819 [Volvox africanus]|uniref:Uncharacterized protein n=1 Tax=Volvox africanus TaxID=51714 RepID=A0ABQ5SH32_9CHLO|nr:hypothetical protein VaNZ11_013819 [Volvox africanus]